MQNDLYATETIHSRLSSSYFYNTHRGGAACMLGQVCFCYTAAGVALEQLKHALRKANSRLCSMLKSGFVKCIGRAQAASLNFLVF